MRFSNPYWSKQLQISTLQRWVVVHSILYYEMDNSIVSDKAFDTNAKQLAQMQKDFPKDAKASQYWYAFKGFDGTTGFDLFSKLSDGDRSYLTKIAEVVLASYNKSKKGDNNGVKRKANN